jgi:hypothetical protein
MISYLYRYAHPYKPTKFIYVGQTKHLFKRDSKHRSGKCSFGRRFKNRFPGVELPQPIVQKVEVKDWQELNELETIWMFQYHTWRGYLDGMNLTLPGSQDYKNAAHLGGVVTAASGQLARNATYKSQSDGGRIQGQRNVESGHLEAMRASVSLESRRAWGLKTASIPGHMREMNHKQSIKSKSKGGKITGRKNAESGHLTRISNLPQTKIAQSKNMRIVLCLRWNINRNKSCVCGEHLRED